MQPSELDFIAILVVATILAVSLVGTVLPAFPGVLLAWIATFVFGLVIGFDAAGVIIMSLITALVVVNSVAMVRIPQQSTLAHGAAKGTVIWGAVGAVLGFFLIPVAGFIVGAVAGVYGAEYARTRQTGPAWAATKGVLIGIGKSNLVQIGIGLLIVILWVIWVVIRFEF